MSPRLFIVLSCSSVVVFYIFSVGLDVHEKHVVSRDIYSIRNATLVNEEAPTSYSGPKEMYIVEDGNKMSSYAAANDGTHDLNNSNKPLHSSV